MAQMKVMKEQDKGKGQTTQTGGICIYHPQHNSAYNMTAFPPPL